MYKRTGLLLEATGILLDGQERFVGAPSGTEFRYSIFPNSPPSDPTPARLRSIDRSRSENRPRRHDQQPQIASSSRTFARSTIQVVILHDALFDPAAMDA
ncbi:hypothetical protein ACLOJK_007075 [Asimina triloba]